jgi:hypothetical protein
MFRRHRIRKYYKDNHIHVYEDSMFDEEEEDKALDAIEKFELHGDFTRCAEDKEAREKAERHAQSREMFDVMNTMRGIQGVAEDDENGLMAMLMELMGAGGPPHGEVENNEMYDDEDEYEYEDEHGYDDEWTVYEGSEDEDGSEGNHGDVVANREIRPATSSNVG